MLKNKKNTLSDNRLVELSKKNPDAFSQIVERYWDRLFLYLKRTSYFNKEDLEDILQETFLKSYKNLNAFDTSLKFSTWIYQITRNTLIDEIRKRNAQPHAIELNEQELRKLLKKSLDFREKLIHKEILKKTKAIIKNLPPKYREVMILRFLEQKDYLEIMDIIQKPKGTVAALINRGRKMVKEEAIKLKII